MTSLTVLKFKTKTGAEEALGVIESLQKQHLITLHDAAIVTWSAGKSKPKTKQLHNLAGLGALDGAFWGMLFGLLFFIPLLGMAIGAAMGALAGHFADIGIDDDFIKTVREKVTPGTSALFLMTSDAVMDKVADQVKKLDFELIASNLSTEQEEQLKAAFAHEE